MMAPRDQVIAAGELAARLDSLGGWHGDTGGIAKSYAVPYDTAIAIVGEIGAAAVELEHRPDIDVRWDRLSVFMTTHTAGDVVTELDFLLAARVDEIAAGYGAGHRIASAVRVPNAPAPRHP
jgi:4a-hydroxytetrahydrobiopterin dehydratase